MLRTRPARRGSASYRFASMGRCAAKEVNQDREIVFRLPELQRLYKQLDKERFAVLGISADTDEQTWREFIAKKRMDWPQYLDRDRKLAKIFRVQPIPTYFVIDGEGIMRRQIAAWGRNQDVILGDENRKWLKALERR